MLYMITNKELLKRHAERIGTVEQIERMKADMLARKAANQGKPSMPERLSYEDERAIERARKQWYGQ
jgi:hypothetical protein